MAVGITLRLPQVAAATGVTTVYDPLGGDGFVAPHSSVYVELQLTGDATGGVAQLILQTDPRFMTLIDYFSLNQADAGAAIDFQAQVQQANGQTWLTTGQIPLIPTSALAAAEGPGIILYPPIIPLIQSTASLNPACAFQTHNLNADTYRMRVKCLQYDREAMHKVAYGVFANNLSPRT